MIQGDCLEVMRDMDDSSIDLIVTDPPYFRVKNEWWDRQWDTVDGFISWVGTLCEQWQRILKPNGSLYVFASPKARANTATIATHVELAISKWFSIIQRITWQKPPFSTKAEMFRKEDLHMFFPASEAIIFAEQYGADSHAKGEAGYSAKCDELRGFVFEPLRAYLDGERKRAGISKGEVNKLFDGPNVGQYWWQQHKWDLPTEEHYQKMRDGFAKLDNNGQYLRREYEDLRREYEDLHRKYEELRREYESLRRPFAVTADVPYTDVWNFPTVGAYPGKHPCEKPTEMLEHIINVSSKPDAVVLDCFAGSGTTGVACVKTGRQFIGIEIEQKWCDVAEQRIVAEEYKYPLLQEM